MSDLNVLVITGRLTKDMEVKQFPTSGTSYGVFSVANNTGYGDFASVQYFNCKLIGKRAESLAPYLKKGQMVGMTGELTSNDWTNKEGQKVKDWQLTVSELQLMGGKQKSDQQELQYEVVPSDDDLKKAASNRYKNKKRGAGEVAF